MDNWNVTRKLIACWDSNILFTQKHEKDTKVNIVKKGDFLLIFYDHRR